MDIYNFPTNVGKVTIDFTSGKVMYDNGKLAGSTNFVSFIVDMSSITAIELEEPHKLHLGGCVLILNNKRYVTKYNVDIAKFTISKADFKQFKEAMTKILTINNLEKFYNIGEVTVPKCEDLILFGKGITPYANFTASATAQSPFIQKCSEHLAKGLVLTDEVQAKLFAQSVELQLLKSPATATFSPLEATTATMINNGVYMVTGYVDSQNSYGAMIRSNYTLTVFKQNDKWYSGDKFVDTATKIEKDIHKKVAKSTVKYWILGTIGAVILSLFSFLFFSCIL